MAEPTRTPNAVRLVAVLAAVVILLLLALPGAARADGDPASDVLASQTLYLPQDAGVPTQQQVQLAAALKAADSTGYRIRVAVIASRSDLGSVTALWHQPQSYARFLGQELSLVGPADLLVVMPSGYGFHRVGAPSAAAHEVLASLQAPGVQLGSAALVAVGRLAEVSGHSLPAVTTTVASPAAATDIIAWSVFAVGGAIIVLAWAASLRARPLRLRTPH